MKKLLFALLLVLLTAQFIGAQSNSKISWVKPGNNLQQNKLVIEENTQYKTIGWEFVGLVSLSIASGVVSWDYFMQAKDLQTTIDYFDALSASTKTKLNTGDLKNSKTRKIIIGVSCGIASFLTLIYAFDSIRISSDGEQIKLSYRF